MDLERTNDQELLRDTAVKFIKETGDPVTVRALSTTTTGMPEKYLQRTADLGWYAMLVPEAFGGGSVSGEGLRDLAIVAEERGRALQPGPFVPMNVVATALARRGTDAQRDEVLASIVAGETLATWAVVGTSGVWEPGAVRATATEGGFLLSGTCGAVQDAVCAEWLLVTAGTPVWPARVSASTAGMSGGPTQFLVPASATGVEATALEGLDLTQRFGTVSFRDVFVPPSSVVGEVGGAAEDVEHQLQIALVLSVSEAIGAMDALFEMTRTYSIDRIAFGRPIGSFQGVKYQLADMSLAVQAGMAIATAATRAVQAGQPDAGEVASMAKAWVGDAAIDIAQGCFQVFGGIGFTWEHDSHLYLRRLTMGSVLFGSPDWHRERICQLHDIEVRS